MKKYQNWLLGPAIVGLALSVAVSTVAQDKPAKEAKPAKKERAKRDPVKGMVTKETNLAEDALGKPLTAEQKTQLEQAIRDRIAATNAAQEAFRTNRARILGITIEEYDTREKAAKAKAAEERKKAKEAKEAKPAG